MSTYPQSWRDRSVRGMGQRAQAGLLPGCAPAGYRNRREPTGEQAPPSMCQPAIIRRAFHLVRDTDLPLREILAEMTERGLRSRGGKPLGISAFHYLLTNPYYTGMVRWKGKIYPGKHQAIVSEELFGAVQKKLRSRRRSEGRKV